MVVFNKFSLCISLHYMFWVTFYKSISQDAFMNKSLKTGKTEVSPTTGRGDIHGRMDEYKWHLTTHKDLGKVVKGSKRVHYTFYMGPEWIRSFSRYNELYGSKTLLRSPRPVHCHYPQLGKWIACLHIALILRLLGVFKWYWFCYQNLKKSTFVSYGFYVPQKLCFPLAAFLIQNHFRHYILRLQFAVNAVSCTLP